MQLQVETQIIPQTFKWMINLQYLLDLSALMIEIQVQMDLKEVIAQRSSKSLFLIT